jgi:hypothetical protein
MMFKTLTALSKRLRGLTLALIMASMTACSALTGGGTATNTLWADVPQLDGATKSSSELPLAARLLVQQMFGSNFGFVGYKTTKSADDIKKFYTVETMQGLGWKADSGGCNALSADTSGGTNAAGGFCTFTREESGKQIGLLILLAQADDTKETNLYYIRSELPATARP